MPRPFTMRFCAALAASLLFAVACGGGGSSPSGAPAVRIPRTGQTVSRVAGDDAALLRGVAWPVPRFTSSESGKTVVDHLTGLMWAGSSSPLAECGWQFTAETKDLKTWPEALAYVACLNERTYLGHADWRLPNRWEMRSLLQNDGLDCEAGGRLRWLKDQGFQFSSTDGSLNLTRFVTSTAMPNPLVCARYDDQTMIWTVDVCGAIALDVLDTPTPSRGVWPVRDAAGIEATARLPATGLTACYGTGCSRVDCAGTGEDGETRKGVAWPSPRFVANADTTITDRLTGLGWAPNGNLPEVDPRGDLAWSTWSGALAVVEELNARRYLGHDDWRMPNINELQTLALADVETASVWEQLDLYGLKVWNADYWSSTWGTEVVASASDDLIWTVDMTWGSQRLASPIGRALLLPVRGP